MTVIPLGMFVFCAYYGIFTFRVSKNYGLFPYRQTEASSLVYSALYVSKLALPMCYNFLRLLSIHSDGGQVAGKTAFEAVMGVMDLVPVLGNDFQQYFPCIIVLLLALNYFELYSTLCQRNVIS